MSQEKEPISASFFVSDLQRTQERMPLNSLALNKLPGKEIKRNPLEVKPYTDGLQGITYSVDDAVNKVGYGKFQILLTCLAGLGWLADAFEVIILSIIGDLIACDWELHRWQNALLTSMVFAGIMFGSPILGIVADIYGRKKSLAGSVVLLFLFGSVSAASPNYTWMAIFRACMGFALGGVAQGLTLCCEYFPKDVRGKAGFYLCYFWSIGTIGVILMAWIIMAYLDNWRILLVAASIPALSVIISLKWYPESARYYLVSNQYEQAKNILHKMASMNGADLPYGRLVQVSGNVKRGRIRDLLGKEYRRATLLFWYIWLAVAFAYYGVALISPIIIQKGGLRTNKEINNTTFIQNLQQLVPCTKFTNQNYIDLLWTSAAEIPGIILFTFLVQRCNRKVLLSGSCFIGGILVFFLLLETDFKIIIFLFLFAARGIILAVFQLLFVMTSEAFPTTIRALAMGTGSAFCRLGGLSIPFVAQVLAIENPIAAISLLGGSIIIAAVAAAFLPLETRNSDMKESHATNQ